MQGDEEAERRHDPLNVHRKVKEIAGIYRKKVPAKLFSENGNLVVEVSEKRNVWTKYIEKMFQNTRKEIGTELYEIPRSEVVNSFKISKA